MSKARTLANLTSDNSVLADGQIAVAEVTGAAPLASPSFTGNITVAGNVDGRDIATDGIKLDTIETNADVTDTANVVGALTAGTNVAIALNGTISSTDTNTTYSVGDGGLTTNDFTNADHSKLDGIAASANNYTHPNHSGEVTSSADGATVITDNVVDEANLKISNTPTNGYVLTAQSGNTGGLTWAEAESGADLYAANESSPTAQPSATGTNAVAIGDSAISTNTNSFAGPLSRAGGTNSIAMGIGNNGVNYGTVGNAHGIAMGQYAKAQGNYDIAIGRSATASGENSSIAIGRSTTASSGYAVAIGYSNSASGNYSIAMGYDTTASANNATAIGSASNYTSKSNASGEGSVAIGGGTATATDSMALGDSRASGTDSFAAQISNNTSSYGASSNNTIAIGYQAKATSGYGGAIGYKAVSTHSTAVAIGRDATTTAADQVAVGGLLKPVRISGQYTLPTSDGTNGQVMTTNGSGAVTFADAGGSTITVDNKTASYTIVSGDVGKIISFSGGSYTTSLTAAATLGNGFYVYIENNAAAGQNTHVVTIDPNASETIDGRSSILLRQGQRILIVCDGSEWKTVADFNRAIATNATTTFFSLPEASGDESVAIGMGSVASSTNTTAIGVNVEATGSYSTSFGLGSDSTASGSMAAGYNARATGDQAVALTYSRASGADSFAAAITNNTTTYGATGANSIAIGKLAKATTEKSVGIIAQAIGTYAIAIGDGTVASGNSSVALGRNNNASATYTTAIGSNCSVQGFKSVGIGRENSINSSHESSLVLGEGIQSTASNQVSIGGTTQDVRISETYTLPKVDGTASGQVLTTNGSGVVSWADAGGGADLYAANESSPTAQPSATGTNAIAIGDGAVSSGQNSLAFGLNTDSTYSSTVAIGTGAQATFYNAIAIGTQANASGNIGLALGYQATASGAWSTAIGLNSGGWASQATGLAATAIGGSRASGADSFSAQISNNTTSYGASGSNSVAIGYNAKSSAQHAFSMGRFPHASGSYGLALGSTAQAIGQSSTAINGSSTSASSSLGFGGDSQTLSGHDKSIVLGFGAQSRAKGSVHFGGHNPFDGNGLNQHGLFILGRATTDATATALSTNTSAATSNNQMLLPNNSAYTFSGTVVAREKASEGTDVGAWEVKGIIRREANAGTTVLVNSVINELNVPTGWAVAVSADTTNGALAVTVTGVASTNIRWVATIQTSEVIYA